MVTTLFSKERPYGKSLVEYWVGFSTGSFRVDYIFFGKNMSHTLAFSKLLLAQINSIVQSLLWRMKYRNVKFLLNISLFLWAESKNVNKWKIFNFFDQVWSSLFNFFFLFSYFIIYLWWHFLHRMETIISSKSTALFATILIILIDLVFIIYTGTHHFRTTLVILISYSWLTDKNSSAQKVKTLVDCRSCDKEF